MCRQLINLGVFLESGISVELLRVARSLLPEHSQAPAYLLIPTSVPASEGNESGKPRTVKPRDIAAVA